MADEKRLEGNAFFKDSNFNCAISAYSEAIKLDPNNAVLFCNRSACFLAQQKYFEAERDARRVIQIDSSSVKGHFRLAAALKGRGNFDSALSHVLMALSLEQSNSACMKLRDELKSLVSQNPASVMPKGFLLSERNSECSSDCCNKDSTSEKFCTVVSNPLPKRRKPKSNTPGRSKTADTGTGKQRAASEIQYNPAEYSMYTQLKKLIKLIRAGDFHSAKVEEHMLQGMFKQLADKKTFADLLFPGSPKEVLELLPKNLKELLFWEPLILDLPKISKSAASVLENIKRKGAARGDTMDAATEAILAPQIIQEALAREIVDAVQKLSKVLSSVNAKVSLNLARIPGSHGSPSADTQIEVDMELYDQIEAGICTALADDGLGVGVQEEYLGDEWTDLITKDAVRFVRHEHLSVVQAWGAGPSLSKSSSDADVDGETAVRVIEVGADGTFDTSGNGKSADPSVRVAWLEPSAIADSYPALAEAIRNLQALPFEINDKTDFSLQLLEPARGSTLLAYYPAGSRQAARLDSRAGDPADSGIRITCAYTFFGSTSKTSPAAFIYSKKPIEESINNQATSGEGAAALSREVEVTAGAQALLSNGSAARDGATVGPGRDAQEEDAADMPSMKASLSGGASHGRLPITNDQLILHRSSLISNERTYAAQDYFVLYFFVHSNMQHP